MTAEKSIPYLQGSLFGEVEPITHDVPRTRGLGGAAASAASLEAAPSGSGGRSAEGAGRISTADELIERIHAHAEKMGGSLDASARAFGYTVEQLYEMVNSQSQDNSGGAADVQYGVTTAAAHKRLAYRGGGRGRTQLSDRDLDPHLAGPVKGMSPEDVEYHRQRTDEIIDLQHYRELERAGNWSDTILAKARLRSSRERRARARSERDRRNGRQQES